jgi:hypothetical protein
LWEEISAWKKVVLLITGKAYQCGELAGAVQTIHRGENLGSA